MSKELLSAVRGSGVGMVVGSFFGIATLNTIGFDRMTLTRQPVIEPLRPNMRLFLRCYD